MSKDESSSSKKEAAAASEKEVAAAATGDKEATKDVATASAKDLGLLEEDDEFEEFPTEDWSGQEEDDNDVNVWEDNWDDDNVEDDFSIQLSRYRRKRALSSSCSPQAGNGSRAPPSMPPNKKQRIEHAAAAAAAVASPRSKSSSNGHASSPAPASSPSRVTRASSRLRKE